MAYSSVKAMLNVSRQNNQPLWDVILQSDLLESGLTRPSPWPKCTTCGR